MFAVIRTGGKQYTVAANQVLSVEKLPGVEGDEVRFEEVLILGDGASRTLGAPIVEGAAVTATVLEQARTAKVLVFKKKRRQRYRRTKGHRQEVTVVRITDILAPGAKAKAAATKTEE